MPMAFKARGMKKVAGVQSGRSEKTRQSERPAIEIRQPVRIIQSTPRVLAIREVAKFPTMYEPAVRMNQ